MRVIRSFFLLPIFVTVACALRAPQVETVDGALAQVVNTRLAAAVPNGFAGAVIVEIDGKPVLRAGYGLANRETGAPFTIETSAQVGSITKSFTAFAISQLAAGGRIDLEAPVATYLDGAASPAGKASLKQLMTHTAGLADYCGDDFEPRSREELLHVCMAKPLEHAPGEEVYSNMGFSIAAAVVDEVSGQAWEAYLADHVWRPFGMTSTGWEFERPPAAGFASGYLADKPQQVISSQIATLHGQSWNLKGNGGLQASATDMIRYAHGLMAAPAVVRDLMLRPHVAGDEPGVMSGYGLFFRTDAAGETWRIGHSGSDGVFFSYLGIYPKQHAVFYFVSSTGEVQGRAELVFVLHAVEDAIGANPDRAPPTH